MYLSALISFLEKFSHIFPFLPFPKSLPCASPLLQIHPLHFLSKKSSPPRDNKQI